MNVSTYQDAVTEIVAALRNGRLATLCGAGISLHSGLPLAGQLVDAVLDKLAIAGRQRDLLLPSVLPFEAFMQSLREESDDLSLLELFRQGDPNVNHVLIAKVVSKGYLRTVCTTNFDELIERALNAEGLKLVADYQLAYDDVTFGATNWGKDAPARIVKIHGSVADRQSMAITLKQVASERLSAPRRAVIERLLSSGEHDTVLILGYSCSDQFDLSPHIETLSEKSKRIFLVEHRSQGAAGVEDLSARRSKHPFHDFPGSRISCNTDDLIRSIWEGCLEEQYGFHGSRSVQQSWRTSVDDWHTELAKIPGGAFAAAGHLLKTVSEWNEALPWFQKALDAAKAAGDQSHAAIFLSNLGLACTHLGRYTTAIQHHDEALRIAEPINDRHTTAVNLQNKGTAYQFLGKVDLAIECYEAAARLAEELNNREGMAACYGAIGSAASEKREFDKAIHYLKHALKIAQDNTDLAGAVIKWSDLGSVYQLAGDLAAAIRCYEGGLDLAKKIGLTKSIGAVLGNLGIVHLKNWDADKAIHYLQQSLEISRALRNPYGEAQSLGGLGGAYVLRHEYSPARECFAAALDIARTIGDPRMIARSCIELCYTHKKLLDDASATRYRDETRETVRMNNLQLDVDAEVRSLEENEQIYRNVMRSRQAFDPNDPIAMMQQLQGATMPERERLKPLGDHLERNFHYGRNLLIVTGIYLLSSIGTVSYHIDHPDSSIAHWLAVVCLVIGVALAVACFKAVGRAAELWRLAAEEGIPLTVMTRLFRSLLKAGGTLSLLTAIGVPLWFWW